MCYSVTDRFFNLHLTSGFEEYSIVWLRACYSAAPLGSTGSMPPLVDVLLNKQAGAVFGWTGSVNTGASGQAAGYFFSRILGHNEGFDPQSPPIRPYDLSRSYQELQNRGYDQDPASGSELVWVPQNYGSLDQTNLLLVPPIFSLSVDLAENELTVQGDFGQNGSPKVTVGGQEVSIKDNDEGKIVADLPEDAQGEANVEVLNHKSNTVPLTQWNGSLDIEGDLDSAKGPHVKATVQFRFRADIHPFREGHPEDPPNQVMKRMAAALFERDGQLQYEFSKTFVDGDYEYKYSDSGNIGPTVGTSGPQAPPMYTGAVTLKPDDGKIEFQGAAVLQAHVTRTNLKTHEVKDYDQYESIPLIFEAPIEKYGEMKGGEATLTGTSLKVTWEDVTAASPSDENTPA